MLYRGLFVKINLNSDELDDLEQLSDGDLAELVRGALKKFRGKSKAGAEAEDDLAEADPSTAGHGGRSESTLETTASQRAGTIRATEDRAMVQQTHDAARLLHESRLQQDERDAEAAKLIPSYRRL